VNSAKGLFPLNQKITNIVRAAKSHRHNEIVAWPETDDRRYYYTGGMNEVCSRTDFAMLLDAGLLEKHGSRYEITTERRRAVLDNLS
jgi:hypothetical protein